MTWTVSAAATFSSAPIGTEVTVKTDTTNATYVWYVDTRFMKNQDVTKFRIYTNVSSASVGPVWQATVSNSGGGIATVLQSPFVASDKSISVAITQITGAGQNYDWKLLRQ